MKSLKRTYILEYLTNVGNSAKKKNSENMSSVSDDYELTTTSYTKGFSFSGRSFYFAPLIIEDFKYER